MRTIKCVVVGDGPENKTSLLVSYTSHKLPSDYIPMVFENFALTVTVDNKAHRLGLFDTAGQEDFDQLRPLGYSETDVFLVCFSVVSRSSFENVREKWVPEITRYCRETPFLLVGTNIHLIEDEKTVENLKMENQKVISFEEGEKLAEELNAVKYMECSAVTRQGLNAVFEEAIRAALRTREPIVDNNIKPIVKTTKNPKKCVIA